MADKLNKIQRLEQNNSRLKNSNAKLRLEIKELKQENNLLKKQLIEIGQQLDNKELQRKNLLEKLYKPNKTQKGEPAKPLGKKPGAKGYHRKKPKDQEVTELREFKPTKCPYCKRSDGLQEPQETIVKYTEDIIIVPEKIIKKYVIHKCWCSNCQEYIRSDKVPNDIERFGPNLMAYILYSRYRLRLPFHLIKQSLKDLHNFDLSEGEISDELEKTSQLFGKDYEAIKELIQISDKVYCDETGWRIRGQNFWIWVFVTTEGLRYVVEDTRGKGVPEEALGKKEDRVLISDFYSAYKNLPGENQYCWVHLLRDSKLTESKFHEDLKEIYRQLKIELTKELQKRRYKRLDKLLEEITKKTYTDKNIQKVEQLQRRIFKNRKELLTCLKYKDVLPENNTAERALRNNVVMRKIFGCSRSVNSAKVMEVNTSVIDSWLMREPDKTFMQIVLPKIKELRGEKNDDDE